MSKDIAKNILLITVDSLRADHISCYNSNFVKTPNIDKLASDGRMYRNVFAGGSDTVTSVSSFLTSVPTPFVSREYPTIQMVLKRHGYNTAALNPNVQIVFGFCKEKKLTKGFDKYDTLLGIGREKFEIPIERVIRGIGKLTTHFFSENNPFNKLMTNLVGYAPLPIAKPAPRAKEINEKAITVLKHSKRPVFLWLFYLDVHEPYLPLQNSLSFKNKLMITKLNRKLRYFRKDLSLTEVKKLHHLYIKEIEQFDKEIGNLIRKLKEENLYEDTIIIFTADHGEQFGEHGGHGHGALYDEVLSVPLIIKNKEWEGERIDGIFSLLDLASTITDIAGAIRPETFFGKSLCKVSLSESNWLNRPLLCFGDVYGNNYCYRKEGWKIIFKESGTELYNLKKDPAEKRNIYDEEIKIAKQLTNDAISYLEKLHNYYSNMEKKMLIRKAINKLRIQ